MGLSTEEAYDILGIPRGSEEEEVRAAYKKLALKWHPDKHSNSDSATKKFQEVSAAYKRLTSDEPDDGSEIILSPSEMFDLFARMFFHARFNDCYDSDDFDDGSDYSNDDDFFNEEDDDIEFIHYLANNCGRGNFKHKTENFNITKNRPSESEARKNAEELVKEEEKQRKQREKKRAKKKRQKEKKRQEKESNEKAKNTETSEDINEENITQNKDKEPYITNENHYSEKSSLGENNPSKSFENKNQTKYADKKSKDENVEQNPLQKQMHKNKKDSSTTNKKQDAHGNTGQSDEEVQGWDTQSAFFARAAATATKKITTNQPSSGKKKDKKSKEQGESIEGMDPIVLRSRQVAVKGNEMANQGLYNDAIQLFTEAINLDSKDFRFFGNRSFCYDRMGQHDKALEDAKKAIQLNKEWPKGYFRKGRALAGLKLYSDAEAAFEHVLKLDKECDDAIQELIRVRTHQLIEMGFSRQQSEAAIRQFTSVQAALDSLLSGMVPQSTESDEEIYISDEEDYIMQTLQENKIDARNPENLTSLWIGNVQPTVTEKHLQELFSQWGAVTSIRMLPEKYCAFVNFKSAPSASMALEKLQGKDYHGRQLLIKFPDNPIVSGQPRTTVIRKNVKPTAATASAAAAATASVAAAVKPVQKAAPQKIPEAAIAKPVSGPDLDKSKVKGPVNGNECYFWRTTGCAFGNSCRYTHTPGTKGVDRKPWQKPTA
ncbi:heat shock protein sti1 homolog [Anneissia japonica]|uniref:heat shock protein sti1 homolog n=1 Tax=Anneissia japonica TaxID=1529436 RepID=UPI001425AA4D|nr:heat shock protein sti1 homolog [Anneissia japonica]